MRSIAGLLRNSFGSFLAQFLCNTKNHSELRNTNYPVPSPFSMGIHFNLTLLDLFRVSTQVSTLEGKNSDLTRKLKEAKGEHVTVDDVETDVTTLNDKVKQLQRQVGKCQTAAEASR